MSDQLDVHIGVSKAWMKRLQQKVTDSTPKGVTAVAYSLLDWIITEFEEGRVVVSFDKSGENVRKLPLGDIREDVFESKVKKSKD